MSGLTSWIAVCLRQCKLAGQSMNLPACKRVRLSVGLSACQPAFCNQVVLTGGRRRIRAALCWEEHFVSPLPASMLANLTPRNPDRDSQRQRAAETDRLTDRQTGRQDRDWVTDRQTKELWGRQMDRWNINAGRQAQRETEDWRCGQTGEERAAGVQNGRKVNGPTAL